MIKNAVFDLGNVVISFDKPRIAAAFADGAEERRFLIDKCLGSPEWSMLDLGEITAEEAARRITLREGGRFRALTSRFFADWYRADLTNADVLALAAGLKAKGYRTFVLSNMQTAAADYFGSIGDFEPFDGVVISGYEHIKKPDPEIFRLLCRRYGIVPSETLFIDDDDNGGNYAAASALGFLGRRVLPNDVGDVRALLNEYGM